MPCGIFIDSCLISLPETFPFKIPVQVRNGRDHYIVCNCWVDCTTSHYPQYQPWSSGNSRLLLKSAKCWHSSKLEVWLWKFSMIWIMVMWQKSNIGSDCQMKHHSSRVLVPYIPDYEAVRKHLQSLLDAGIIRESTFSSPIVVCNRIPPRKRNGDVRLCVYYLSLNLQTIKDAYALPNLEESFSVLSGSRWWTSSQGSVK